jgi:hypothetical protein
MVHRMLADSFTINAIPDFKRTYRARRWRKLRHLARISLTVSSTRRDHQVLYLWDDLSLVMFSPRCAGAVTRNSEAWKEALSTVTPT